MIIRQEALTSPWLLGSQEIIFTPLQSQKPLSCLAFPPRQAPQSLQPRGRPHHRPAGCVYSPFCPLCPAPPADLAPQTIPAERTCIIVIRVQHSRAIGKARGGWGGGTDRCLCHMFSAVSCKRTVALAQLAERGNSQL